MAVSYTYAQTVFLLRDEADSGYYVFLTTCKSNAPATITGIYAAHTADTDGYIYESYGDMKIELYDLFSSYIDGLASGNTTAQALVIY